MLYTYSCTQTCNSSASIYGLETVSSFDGLKQSMYRKPKNTFTQCNYDCGTNWAIHTLVCAFFVDFTCHFYQCNISDWIFCILWLYRIRHLFWESLRSTYLWIWNGFYWRLVSWYSDVPILVVGIIGILTRRAYQVPTDLTSTKSNFFKHCEYFLLYMSRWGEGLIIIDLPWLKTNSSLHVRYCIVEPLPSLKYIPAHSLKDMQVMTLYPEIQHKLASYPLTYWTPTSNGEDLDACYW